MKHTHTHKKEPDTFCQALRGQIVLISQRRVSKRRCRVKKKKQFFFILGAISHFHFYSRKRSF